ncbi:MAG: hypothetical protein ABIB61_03035 [Candidatus Shapirobacteria bacterium]
MLLPFYYFNATPKIKNCKQADHLANLNTKFGGGGKREQAKIPSPQPPSFLSARVFSLAREARRQFRSKKVRISSNKRTTIKLSGILPTDSAARSAERSGNTGSPRTARLAKRRFEIPCDFSICFARKRIFAIMNLRPQINDCLF